MNAPKVTDQDINFAIDHANKIQYHVFPETTVTVCCVELSNGFRVVGYAAAVSQENFDKAIGEGIALDNVREKLWELLGFRLKQALFERVENG